MLVSGAWTSVGIDAVQLARNCGYSVIVTASLRNFDWVRSLGAAEAVDRTSATAMHELVSILAIYDASVLELIGDLVERRAELPV